MFCANNVEHVNYRYLMKNLPRTSPEGRSCPDLVGAYCRRVVLAGTPRYQGHQNNRHILLITRYMKSLENKIQMT